MPCEASFGLSLTAVHHAAEECSSRQDHRLRAKPYAHARGDSHYLMSVAFSLHRGLGQQLHSRILPDVEVVGLLQLPEP